MRLSRESTALLLTIGNYETEENAPQTQKKNKCKEHAAANTNIKRQNAVAFYHIQQGCGVLFCGTLTPGLENLGIQTPTPASM